MSLVRYAYDALGRRIEAVFDPDDPNDAVTVRYYHDGMTVIEERDGADALTRYHVNGTQQIDEPVATYTVGAAKRGGSFTYHLPGQNGSIIGSGSSDGTVTRLDYDTSGSFTEPPGPSGYHHDADADLDVDLHDLMRFQHCFGRTGVNCRAVHDFDAAGVSDGVIDADDWEGVEYCQSTADEEPDAACAITRSRASSTPPTGTFALHGRSVDVLSDGKVLYYFRARYYDPAHARWLQRDPSGYTDGANLYEAFGSNSTVNRDPMGLWIMERIGEILQEKGEVKVADIAEMSWELRRSSQKQITPLTAGELALLNWIGGAEYGSPWTEETLSAGLKERADNEFAGLGLPYRYQAEATYATRRRIMWLLLFKDPAFASYMTELYRLTRDINPFHFAFERGWQIGGGEEAVTGEKVSRLDASFDLAIYFTLIKGAQVVPGAVTRMAGGEVPGSSTPVVPGRPTTATEDLLSLRSAQMNEAGVIKVNPAELRWTQTSAGGNGRAAALRASMAARGYAGEPIDVVRTADGLTTVDHTRAAVALELGIREIPARVHLPSEPLPPSMTGRFGPARTWGEAAAYRAAHQRTPLPPTGTTTPPTLPPR